MPPARRLLRHLPFARRTTPLQAATYLLGVALFSISFLVFLNSSISFVITDRIGVTTGVGDIVGTLGFADELVALVACPVWGLVSDRLGVRLVAVTGYAVLALALVLSVQATNVYPQLLLARILFAVGATAAATMVTAILPSLTAEDGDDDDDDDEHDHDHDVDHLDAAAMPKPTPDNPRNSVLSTESQLTITPERFADRSRWTAEVAAAAAAAADVGETTDGLAEATAAAGDAATDSVSTKDGRRTGKPAKLAGFVGLFTGCGALVALVLFLPLPVQFGRLDGVPMAAAVTYSFYVVALVAVAVAGFVFVGLRHLRGEEGKGWRMLWGRGWTGAAKGTGLATRRTTTTTTLPYARLLREAVRLGGTDPDIALGYLGGFVARASTVAISLFVPLFVNAFFIGHGFCQGAPNDPSPELKKECRAAYVLAAVLTGVAQLVGLLCAPVFGYVAARSGRGGDGRRRRCGPGCSFVLPPHTPLVVATTCGVVGYVVFPQLASPEPRDVDGRGGTPAVLLVVALLGVSQIGAIVCSLGALGQGVLAGREDGEPQTTATTTATRTFAANDHEDAPLLFSSSSSSSSPSSSLDLARPPPTPPPSAPLSRIQLKGSIAGVYSWCGGAAILLLTKLGGYFFDTWSRGAPFYLMAAFNGVLLAASLGIDAHRAVQGAKR
ncbi:major facilitator superfamily transporter [Niveomyces insectorum RCEF 264]|uniref:Major facilitator superfamily transporter n=1 Tax=Niveomyces insectorum RCEF 264 TaxID=1081102 RepID=A0A167RIA0_9HYPO|nr:major facilitator superfamily transporter [Niveomyces insectorum RCEF 264]